MNARRTLPLVTAIGLPSLLGLLGLLGMACLAGCNSSKRIPDHPMRMVGATSFLDGVAAKTDSGRVRVVVEIPTGTLAKWEVDKSDGALVWTVEDGAPRVVRFLGYPGNYGMVPRTLLPKELGGDGDPLDVLVLGAPAERGTILEVRLIGVLEMLDRGEQDDKLIAVAPGTPFERVLSIAQLDIDFPGASEILRKWFESYKGPGLITVERFSGPTRAEEILEAAISAF